MKKKKKSYKIDLLMMVQNGMCAYCGDPLMFEDKTLPSLRITIDHVIPKSKGGVDRPENWVLVHSRCNGIKSNLLPEEILKLLKNMRKTFTTLTQRNKKMDKLSEKEIGVPPPAYVPIPKKLKPLPLFKVKKGVRKTIEINWLEVERRKKLYAEAAEATA